MALDPKAAPKPHDRGSDHSLDPRRLGALYGGNTQAAEDARKAMALRRSSSQAADQSSSVETEVVGPLGRAATPKMKLPQGYMLKEDGIYFNPQGEGTRPFSVCGRFDIVAQTRDDLGNNWGLLLHWIDDDGRHHYWAMPMAMLAGDGGEIRAALLDGGLQIATSRQGREKFIELLTTVNVTARARAVDKVGWTDGAFALPDRTIGDSPERRVIYQGSAALNHAYRVSGTLEQWQENVASLGIGNSRLALALCAAFVGPLLSILGEEGGGVNLRGASSTGKSTALFAAASVWGSPAFVAQWRTTSNGLEGLCVQHNETLLCLDELGQLDPREASISAYMIANGTGKARAGRSGGLRPSAKWHVMFISTGEISLADLAGRDARGAKRSAAGQEIRILDIEADAGTSLGLFEALHGSASAEAFARRIKESAATTYGVAGPAFVERIIGRAGEISVALKTEINDFVAEHVPARASGQVSRGARRFALIAAAGELAVRLGILPWPSGEATTACATIFRQWLSGRGGVGSAEDREAIARVRGFLEMHGGSRFESVDASDETRIINRAGFWRESENGREYLFLAEAWKNEVCVGMDAGRVAKLLGERGLLRRDSAGKNSISVTLPGGIGKTRCYVINAAIFDGDANA